MKEKKKHHYIPASYLKGFTNKGKRSSSFWAIPKDNSKPFLTNPNDACAQRNYYKVDSLPDNPLIVEDWYAETIEPKIACVLDIIRKKSTLPDDSGIQSLILFAATLYLRNPRYRELASIPHIYESKLLIDLLAGSKSLYESSMTKALADGYITEKLKYEEFKHQYYNGGFEFQMNKDYLIEHELKILEKIMNMLANRKWILLVIPEYEAYELITSDKPFILTHPTAKIYGLGTKNTEILIPISKRSLLIGLLEVGENNTYNANKHHIGVANVTISINCNRVFFASNESIICSNGSESWFHNIQGSRLSAR